MDTEIVSDKRTWIILTMRSNVCRHGNCLPQGRYRVGARHVFARDLQYQQAVADLEH